MPGARSEDVLAREQLVLERLGKGPIELQALADDLSLSRNHAYASVWRLALRGQVEKVRVGTRVPVWQLTDAGAAILGIKRPAPVTQTSRAERASA